MTPPKVLLVACGAFNPPTNMHLRMFEIARDNMSKTGYKVVGGVVSPTHDSYQKKDLISSTDRCAMLQLALKNSDWIKLSSWESHQETWTRTRLVLQYHQNQLNSVVNESDSSPNKRQRREDFSWMPDDLKCGSDGPIEVKLLCGADLLESFGTPGLWSDEDIETIVGHHGIIVITREGSNPYKFIYESDLLTKYQSNIIIITEWITNEVSSTKVRRALRRSESVKYLIPDTVIDYIKRNNLYKIKDNDVNMGSPSPTAQVNGIDLDNSEVHCNDAELHTYIHKPKNGPLTCVRVECIDDKLENEDHLSEKLANEENSKRSTISYPGQAVQIISTLTGDKIHKQVSETIDHAEKTLTEEPVANVQIQITKDGIKVISDKETTV